MIFPPRLTKSTTDFSHTLNQLLVKQIFLQVQVIFTIAWKKQISGEPNLTGVLPSSPPTTDLFLTLLQRLVPTASLIRVRPLVAVSQG